MRNITVSVSDPEYRAARIWAAANGTTVSAIVRKLLRNLPGKEEDLPQLIASLTDEQSHPAECMDLFLFLRGLDRSSPSPEPDSIPDA